MPRLALLLLVLCLALPAAGEPGGRDIEEVLRPSLRTYEGRTGLARTTVYSLVQDREGRLWAATKDGAACYDGRAWTSLPMPGASAASAVRAILPARDGAKWFGMENGGLWRLQGGAWTSTRAEIPHERINCLAETFEEDGTASLWAGTGGGGVARFRRGAWTLWDTGSGLPSGFIWKFIPRRDAQGRETLWAATTRGFARFDGEAWSPVGGAEGFPEGEVNDLVEIPRPGGPPEVWVSVWGRGMMRRSEGRWTLFDPANGFPSRRPVTLSLTRGADGRPTLWAATYEAGLACFERGRWRVLGEDLGLPSKGVYALCPSLEGRPTLWLGLRGAGVVALDQGGWLNLDKGGGLPFTTILSFLDGSQRFWVGMDGGLASWDGRRWKVEGRGTGFPPGPVHALCRDGETGGVWAGGLAGLVRLRGDRWELVPDPLVRGREVASLLETRDGRGGRGLWIGLEEGLVRYVNGRFEAVRDLEGIGVYALAETRDGEGRVRLWAGTRGRGLWCLEGGVWTRTGVREGFPNDWVYCLKEWTSADGRRWLWAGTFGGGLARCLLTGTVRARWQTFNTETLPGLPSRSILGIQGDARGRVCLATSQGVARLSFEDARNPAVPTGVETFTLADGLPALQCNMGAFLTDQRGRLWVGTNQGAAMLDPARETAPAPARALVLDRILVRGIPRSLEAGAVLGHRDNQVAFEFFLPAFHREEELRYRTRLEGLETEPGPWTSEGRREFSALPHGRYTLRVWARDYQGRQVGPLSFPFRVKPAPWLAPWALGAYALSLALALLGLHGLRVRIFQERNRELEARVREATEELRRKNEDLERINEEKNKFMGIAAHDLKNPLNTLYLSIQELLEGGQAPEDVDHWHRMMERAVRQMIELVKSLLDVNRLDTGHLQVHCRAVGLRLLLLETAMDFQERGRAKGIRILPELPEDELPVWADPLHLQEVVENLLSNALKFTPPDPGGRLVWVRAGREGDRVFLEVQDQGPGLTEEDRLQAFQRFRPLSARPTAGEPSTGLGLSITKALVEAMGGEVSLPRRGSGATFRVTLAEAPPGGGPGA